MKAAMRGFSLIEVVVAMAIVAILATIAYPSYQDSLRKSRRGDAKSVLLQAAQWMERFYTENNRYDQNRAGAAVALPTDLTTSPLEGTTKYYTVTLVTVTQNNFTLNAIPIAGTDQARDTSCQTLTLTNTGAKGILIGGSPGSATQVEQCWR